MRVSRVRVTESHSSMFEVVVVVAVAVVVVVVVAVTAAVVGASVVAG